MSGSAGAPLKAVTMRIGDEVCALGTETVREIIEVVPITPVPHADPCVGGLINVRGNVVPLVDLRVLFGMERRPADDDTRIVVVEVALEGEPIVAGLLADRVFDVTEIERDLISPPPPVGLRWPRELLNGIANRDGAFVILPDIPRIFAMQARMGGASDTAWKEPPQCASR